MKANQYDFCAADFAGIVDPVRLQARRAQARGAARQRAVWRVLEAHRDEYDAVLAEEREAMDREFLRQLQATKDHIVRERLGGVA